MCWSSKAAMARFWAQGEGISNALTNADSMLP